MFSLVFIVLGSGLQQHYYYYYYCYYYEENCKCATCTL